MSWQCPICETVNQDITPVCTVCDNLAPVIESYLSLEAIERLRDYNEKLDVIHALEIEGRFEDMLDESLQAISLYKENGLALEKARHALTYLSRKKLTEQLQSSLNGAMGKRDYRLASVIINLADSLSLVEDAMNEVSGKIKTKVANIKEVDMYLKTSYDALIELDTNTALQVVEEGILKHTHSKRLKKRREDIKIFITKLNDSNRKGSSRTPKIPIIQRVNADIKSPKDIPVSDESNSGKSKRKFPSVKR